MHIPTSRHPDEDSRIFRIAMNVAAGSRATFQLAYHDILQRRLGRYQHVTNVNPGMGVRDFKITVLIEECMDIVALRVLPPSNATSGDQGDVTGRSDY